MDTTASVTTLRFSVQIRRSLLLGNRDTISIRHNAPGHLIRELRRDISAPRTLHLM